MSVGFGFSIGDIVLMSQVAYRLYTAATTGRDAAGKDLKELSNALFGLHCALDHLGKTTKQISARAFNRPNSEARDLQTKLNLIIDSCASTLEELDKSTKKYRDISCSTEIDNRVETVAGNPRQRTVERWRKELKVQWYRVLWDFKGKSLSEYRERLHSHTAVINVLLNTFIWRVLLISLMMDLGWMIMKGIGQQRIESRQTTTTMH
jgi:hypothetical protein